MDDKEKTKGEETYEEKKKVRVILKGTKVKPLEDACSEIITRAQKKDAGFVTSGPMRMPTKILRITTRKSPCGEGTNTWDRYEMRIHKRVIDIFCPISAIKDITSFKIDHTIEVNLTVHV